MTHFWVAVSKNMQLLMMAVQMPAERL